MAVAEQVNAKKETLGPADALALAKTVDEIIAMKGKKVVRYRMKTDKPSKDDLLAIMLGPTGNMRAPTMRVGKTLLIGFDEDTYKRVLK